MTQEKISHGWFVQKLTQIWSGERKTISTWYKRKSRHGFLLVQKLTHLWSGERKSNSVHAVGKDNPNQHATDTRENHLCDHWLISWLRSWLIYEVGKESPIQHATDTRENHLCDHWLISWLRCVVGKESQFQHCTRVNLLMDFVWSTRLWTMTATLLISWEASAKVHGCLPMDFIDFFDFDIHSMSTLVCTQYSLPQKSHWLLLWLLLTCSYSASACTLLNCSYSARRVCI